MLADDDLKISRVEGFELKKKLRIICIFVVFMHLLGVLMKIADVKLEKNQQCILMGYLWIHVGPSIQYYLQNFFIYGFRDNFDKGDCFRRNPKN